MKTTECPVCGLPEDEWNHQACEDAQQVEPYDPEVEGGA